MGRFVLVIVLLFQVMCASRAVEVRDFGALGDGRHDDAPAIQEAVASLQKTGGSLHFSTGIYMLGTSAGGVENYPNGKPIESAIVVRGNNIEITGETNTVLMLMAGKKMRAISITGSHATVKNIIVDGNKSLRNGSVSWPGGDVVDALIYFDSSARYGAVIDCEARNGIEDGFGFWKCDDAIIRHCHAHDNGTVRAGGAGISLSGGARARAIGNRSENNSYGIWCSFGSRDALIQSNLVNNNSHEGIIIGGSSPENGLGGNTGFIITDNVLDQNGRAGCAAISIACASNGRILGNLARSNYYAAIGIGDDGVHFSTNWQLAGNICQDNGHDRDAQISISPRSTANADWREKNRLTFTTSPR